MPDEAEPTSTGGDLPDDRVPVDGVIVPDLTDVDLDLGGVAGAGGLDFGDLLGMVGGVGQQILEAQEQANQTVVEGQAGGGVVKVTVTGGLVFQSVTIDPEVVDPSDIDLLQDLVLAALHDAMARVNELGQTMNPLAAMDLGAMTGAAGGGLGGLLGGLDLGGLFGGRGGDEEDDEEWDDEDWEDDSEWDDDADDDDDDGAAGAAGSTPAS